MSDPSYRLLVTTTKEIIVKLTKRGNRVVSIAAFALMIGLMLVAGRVDAMDQCAKFQADNNYQDALDAGCSFNELSTGEYPYTWEAK
jgi:hypothetical protein